MEGIYEANRTAVHVPADVFICASDVQSTHLGTAERAAYLCHERQCRAMSGRPYLGNVLLVICNIITFDCIFPHLKSFINYLIRF